MPDVGEIAKTVLKSAVQNKVQEVLGDKLDSLGIKFPGSKKKSVPADEPQETQPSNSVDDLINEGAKKLFDKLF